MSRYFGTSMRHNRGSSNFLSQSDRIKPSGPGDQRPRSAPASSSKGLRHAASRSSESTDSCDSGSEEDPSTPVNEDLTYDEFEWIRSSPILTNLLAGKELELATEVPGSRNRLSMSSNEGTSRGGYKSESERPQESLMSMEHPTGRKSPNPQIRRCQSRNTSRSPCVSNRSSYARDDHSGQGLYDPYAEKYGGGPAHHQIYFPPPPPIQPPPPCPCHLHPGTPYPQYGDYRSTTPSHELHHLRSLEYSPAPYGEQCHQHHRHQMFRYNSEFAMRLYATDSTCRRRSLVKNGDNEEFNELQERCKQLENDKENLTLQVSVLNDHIEILNDKAKDMEAMIREKQEHLNDAEEMLRQELLNKSSMECNKMDMVSNISHLKLKMTKMEQQNMNLEDKLRSYEIDDASLKLKILDKDSEIASLQAQYTCSTGKKSNVETSTENEKLHRTIDSLMTSNNEKDNKIEEMKRALKNYRKCDLTLNTQGNKSNGFCHADDEMSDSALATTPSSSHKSDPDASPIKYEHRLHDRPPPVPRHSSSPFASTPTATSTPINSATESSPSSQQHRRIHRANSAEEISVPNKTPPVRARHGVKHYGTIPRQHAANLLEQLEQDAKKNGEKSSKSSGSSFVPDESMPDISESKSSATLKPSDLSPSTKDKPKGLKKIFGKLRRSSSGGIEAGEFKRGGMRATAGPRLGWSRDLHKPPPMEKLDAPFSEWNKDQIATWLHSLGLTAYMGDCKRWVKDGAHMLKAKPHQIEKELGMKNAFHRKKLHLALQAVTTANSCQDEAIKKMGELDYHWVTRWLDDIGIPQYKDVFNEARIDGRVLHNLTIEDLFNLKITNLLHHICIKRGIQVLRLHNYDSNCLRRRPIPGESRSFKLEDVALWTNHRVMEWLRSVDLSEYAPNLRGSGVHGALMVYEPKFNTDLLATLLSIPPSKTLLRRHLSTHYKELLGLKNIQEKRDLELSPGNISLIPSAKVKAVRRGQFTLRKKSKSDVEFEDYVCPMSIQCLSEFQDEDRQDTEISSKEIEAVSDEIDSLTTMLKDDVFLANMTTTNV